MYFCSPFFAQKIISKIRQICAKVSDKTAQMSPAKKHKCIRLDLLLFPIFTELNKFICKYLHIIYEIRYS